MTRIVPRSPIVDISTLNAIQSKFQGNGGTLDPWMGSCLRDFVDLAIYADSFQVPLPFVPSRGQEPNLSFGPSILQNLTNSPDLKIGFRPYSTDQLQLLTSEQLEEAAPAFQRTALSHGPKLKQWLEMHSEKWIQVDQRGGRLKYQFVYDFERLRNQFFFSALAGRLAETGNAVSVEQLEYAFDVVVRYPFYGSLVGKDDFYLNHPIRGAFDVKGFSQSRGLPRVPIPFGHDFERQIHHLSEKEFVEMLLRVREFVWDHEINRMHKFDDVEQLRKLAADAEMRPKLRGCATAMQVVLGGVGALIGALVGAKEGASSNWAMAGGGIAGQVAAKALDLTGQFYKNELSAGWGKISWLRWALEWEIERDLARYNKAPAGE